MKAVSVSNIKKELKEKSQEDLMDLCLRLAKFKKENKELLTYLLFEAEDESGYVKVVKEEIDSQFGTMNMDSFHYMKKTMRKVLRVTKKYIRYSKKEETECELLLYYCKSLKEKVPGFRRDKAIANLYERQLLSIEKAMLKMHEDLQYDFRRKMESL